MISGIKGILRRKQPPVILIETAGGLLYELTLSMNSLYALPDVDQEISLHTHFVVREDTQQLYGFAHLDERRLFQALLKANGVGPKLAITILSSISVEEFVQCVHHQDTVRLVKLPGVGKKTAERLVLDMRDRLSDWFAGTSDALGGSETTLPTQPLRALHQDQQDAISALVALGYKPPIASRAISQLDNLDTSSTEDIIRLALQQLSTSKTRSQL